MRGVNLSILLFVSLTTAIFGFHVRFPLQSGDGEKVDGGHVHDEQQPDLRFRVSLKIEVKAWARELIRTQCSSDLQKYVTRIYAHVDKDPGEPIETHCKSDTRGTQPFKPFKMGFKSVVTTSTPASGLKCISKPEMKRGPFSHVVLKLTKKRRWEPYPEGESLSKPEMFSRRLHNGICYKSVQQFLKRVNRKKTSRLVRPHRMRTINKTNPATCSSYQTEDKKKKFFLNSLL